MVRKPLTPEELSKRELTLEAKYGGKAALAAKRREWQAKSRIKYTGNGGFRSLSPEKRREISQQGLRKRWGKDVLED